jgi:hypothetical protein
MKNKTNVVRKVIRTPYIQANSHILQRKHAFFGCVQLGKKTPAISQFRLTLMSAERLALLGWNFGTLV